ncbi:alpha/beta hydrolase [Chitinimonas sp.]|uniref:RBBP9/YdeN family alpha/beta hydrolase n=1 Tax=Chitinimonas sp. TaxID=1934313 RepID=UPI002F949F38
MRIVIHPGWQDSGPNHWQSLWQTELPQASRVAQADWRYPEREGWVAALDAHLGTDPSGAVVVCHSLGCLTLAHWAARCPQRAAQLGGALLVAPADVERAGAPPEITGFAPIPRQALPFPSIVVASDDDPYSTLARSEALANAWRARLVVLQGAGHINAAAGFGPWPQGRDLLASLLT